jgi:hypothetical protein
MVEEKGWFMKGSWFNKLFFCIPIMTIFIPACGGEMTKYEWMASESAPRGYPMQILDGSFYDSQGGGLYIPARKKMHDGWGVEVSRHIVGDDKKYLPSSFDVLYFSYTENTFYQGKFSLPDDKIYKLFDEGYYSPKRDNNITYQMIVVGVAPGGLVSVWLKGLDRTTEVYSGQADKVDVPWEKVNSSKKITREEYVSKVLEREIGREGIERIKLEGIPDDLWEKYRKRYYWTPKVTGMNMPAVINNISFYNGERDYFSPKYGNDWSDKPKAVPSSLYFIWKYGKDTPLSLKVELNEEEIINSFEAISSKTRQPIEFNIHIEELERKLFYQFTLHAGNESIELKKVTYEQYQAALIGERLDKFLKDN